jgi:hypothetical protein
MSIIETNFPHVYIHFENDNNLTKDGVSKYLNYWNYRQHQKTYFSCTLDTTAIKDIDIYLGSKHAMVIAKFIKAMKKQSIQYLTYTILIMPNQILGNLLDTILKITKPCATVYIVNTKQEGDMLYQTIKRNNPIEINALLIINEIKCIKSK